MKSILALLARLVHVGVDPAKPRQETKHIVLTNAFAAIFALNMALATVAGSGPPFARVIAGTGAIVVSAREMARVERDLVAEREKTKAVLEQEVGHQVAERSRELGRALSRGESSAPSLVLSKGDRFHTRYRVVRPLGEGGMGAVYDVERLTDAARLALKVVTGTGTNAARFAREAEIGARVHHANLVSIVDVGVADGGAPFLVMELVKGGSLEDRRARFGDAAWALPILRQVVEGLLALHDAAVVHRDLKPANVLLSGTEGSLVAKISDFGISRFGPPTLGSPIDPRAATVAASASPVPSHLTSTGAMLGTPLYMAPEAARGGRAVEASADVFAFGILAYEAITGRSPFTMPPVLLALAGQALPAVAPMGAVGIDGGVRDCVLACLSEDAAARPTARRVRDALGA